MTMDIKTLEALADRLERDGKRLGDINSSAAPSIATIIRDAIGAPISWPSRVAGAQYADEYYPGSPDLRMAFNHGVKWAVERYAPTVPVNSRKR